MANNKDKNGVHNFELEELAADLCGLDSDNVENDEIDTELIAKYNITLEDFQGLLQALWPRLAIGISPLTEKAMIGFLNTDKTLWCAKSDITPMFITGVLQWMGATEMEPDSKGVSRVITANDKPEYELIVKRATEEVPERIPVVVPSESLDIQLVGDLTLDFLKEHKGIVFATGLTTDRRLWKDEVRWIAKVGDGHYDWAIYYHHANRTVEWIKTNGDKVTTESIIRELVPCTDEAFAHYRS